jgi:leucyl-tRNA synthetase
MVDKADKSQDMPRLKRLREIEVEMKERFTNENIWQVDAPEDYSQMSLEEKNKTKYMATFPYPYMNGNLHLGHGYTISKAEFMIRYQRQLGKRVLFPFGFHCTGMPIQAAANRLKREIASGEVRSKQPTAEEKKKNPKLSVPYTQYEIMMQLGIPEADITKFQDPYHWFATFPNEGKGDL